MHLSLRVGGGCVGHAVRPLQASGLAHRRYAVRQHQATHDDLVPSHLLAHPVKERDLDDGSQELVGDQLQHVLSRPESVTSRLAAVEDHGTPAVVPPRSGRGIGAANRVFSPKSI